MADERVHQNGSVSVYTDGPWKELLAVRHCPCADGVTRRATITGQPDTCFSIPARVTVRGKTVSGFVTTTSTYREGVKEGFEFVASKYGRNAALLEPTLEKKEA